MCALTPFVWNKVSPQLDPSEIHIPLSNDAPIYQSEQDSVVADVRLEDEGTKQFIFFYSEWRTLDVNLELAGRYSVYGVSERAIRPDLKLTVNDILVSTLAFYRGSDGHSEDTSPLRIATGVEFKKGSNKVEVRGWNVQDRPLLLVLRREFSLTFLSYSYFLTISLIVYVVLLLITPEKSPTPRARLLLTLGTTGVILIGIPIVLLIFRRDDMRYLGDIASEFSNSVQAFEDYLESDDHIRNRELKRSVVAFGDSTHFHRLEPDECMIPALSRRIPEDLRDSVELYGISSGGFSAFDYYFLLNRIVSEAPDLVIIPVNQRWFSDFRMYNGGVLNFRTLEGYLLLSEYRRVIPLKVGNREFSLVGLALARLDRELEHFGITRLYGGIRVWLIRMEEYLNERIAQNFSKKLPPIPTEIIEDMQPKYSVWNTDISEDHEFFRMFRLINRLANQYDVPVLYYTCNQNVKAQLKHKLDLRLPENTATIKKAIVTNPSVYFLDLAASNPPYMFSDGNEHLSPEGIEKVADELMQATLQILGENPSNGSFQKLERGPR